MLAYVSKSAYAINRPFVRQALSDVFKLTGGRTWYVTNDPMEDEFYQFFYKPEGNPAGPTYRICFNLLPK